jgi:hypothetical protein
MHRPPSPPNASDQRLVRCIAWFCGVWNEPMKWISVIKKLPKWGERVLVAHRRYDWSNARHKWTRLKRLGVKPATFWMQDENGPRFTDGEDVVAEPVAWMPLPAPPTDSK